MITTNCAHPLCNRDLKNSTYYKANSNGPVYCSKEHSDCHLEYEKAKHAPFPGSVLDKIVPTKFDYGKLEQHVLASDHTADALKYVLDTKSVLEKMEPTIVATHVQVGGSHYKGMAIQPIEFTMKNKLDFCQGNVVKYVTRFREKNGIEDLKKAKHYIDLLIEFEYGGTNGNT